MVLEDRQHQSQKRQQHCGQQQYAPGSNESDVGDTRLRQLGAQRHMQEQAQEARLADLAEGALQPA